MGKRKLHGQTYYQCDWTGFPMRSTNCYMPTWSGSKLVKRGSYCNWESVLAHARHMFDVEKSMSQAELDRTVEYLAQIMGSIPDHKEYHFSFLDHFKDDADYYNAVSSAPRNWSMETYHEKCCLTVEEVTAVKISSTGDVFDVIMDPVDGKYDFANYLTRPYMLQGGEHTLAQFQTTKKGKLSKDRDVTVFYWPFKNGLPVNTAASNIFKMQIYGDVLLVQQTKECAFRPRDRYVNFTKQLFEDLFHKKKKRTAAESVALTEEEFLQMKAQMQSSLNGFEQQVSSQVQRPQDLAQAAMLPPPTGKELKVAAEVLGHVPPEKLQKLEARLVAPLAG